MPANDLILNVRQIAGYPQLTGALDTDTILLQRGGLGGPYFSIYASTFIATALSDPDAGMLIGGDLHAGGVITEALSATGLTASSAAIATLTADDIDVLGVPVATQADIAAVNAAWQSLTVHTVNGRRGDVILSLADIPGAAPIFSPRFLGSPRADTPDPCSHSSRLATTAFVHRNSVEYITKLLSDHPFVFTFNGRSGDVVLTAEDLQGAAAEILTDTPLTGVPTAPTAPAGTSTTQLATTAFVTDAIASAANTLQAYVGEYFAPIDSPAFTGYPSAPTAAAGSSTAQIATTAFVMNAVADSVAGVATFNGRAGNVALEASDITNATGALLNSPVFTGNPQAPTQSLGDNSGNIATTAFVIQELGGATIGVMSFNGRGGAVVLAGADITAAGGALLASPALTGIPTAPTAASGTSTDQLATTAFVQSAIGGIQAGVVSFNGRAGVITLTANDISAAGGAVLASPVFTGAPSAPTAAPGSNSTQLATTAYVAAAIATAGGVTSVGGRTGAVTINAADITGAGGALLANPTFTGTPQAPTAALGTNTAQLATTAFVNAQIAAGYLPLTGGTLTGGLTISPASVGGSLTLNKALATGQSNNIISAMGGVDRWILAIGDGTTESGSNVGSNFSIIPYSDAGAAQPVAFAIIRSSGQLTNTPGAMSWAHNGALTLSNVTGMSYWTNNGLIIESATTCASMNRTSAGAIQNFYNTPNTLIGSISSTGTTTAFNTTSDKRLKTDLKSFDAGPMIDLIEVWDFAWRPEHGRSLRSVVRGKGVLAQDCLRVFPDAITHDDEKDSWGADYSKFVPLLLQEVKALRARVKSLEAAA